MSTSLRELRTAVREWECCLGFLRRTLFSCPQNVKEAAYKGIVRPILEYGSSVWDPHPEKLQEELEKVQNRSARFVRPNKKIGVVQVTRPTLDFYPLP